MGKLIHFKLSKFKSPQELYGHYAHETSHILEDLSVGGACAGERPAAFLVIVPMSSSRAAFLLEHLIPGAYNIMVAASAGGVLSFLGVSAVRLAVGDCPILTVEVKDKKM